MKPTLSFTEEIDLIDAHGCKNTIKRAVRLGMGIRENTGIHSWQAGRRIAKNSVFIIGYI